MGDESLVTTAAGAIISTIAGLIIVRLWRFAETRSKKKDDVVKEALKTTNTLVRQHLEKLITDSSVKTSAMHIDSNIALKDELMKKITTELADVKQKISTDSIIRDDIQSKLLLNSIGIVEAKLTSMISALDIKSDMTKETIEKLRSDVIKIQLEMDRLIEKMYPSIRRQVDSEEYRRLFDIRRGIGTVPVEGDNGESSLKPPSTKPAPPLKPPDNPAIYSKLRPEKLVQDPDRLEYRSLNTDFGAPIQVKKVKDSPTKPVDGSSDGDYGGQHEGEEGPKESSSSPRLNNTE